MAISKILPIINVIYVSLHVLPVTLQQIDVLHVKVKLNFNKIKII
jgi:hypothetical protein